MSHQIRDVTNTTAFTCEMEGQPTPTIQWMKGKSSIINGNDPRFIFATKETYRSAFKSRVQSVLAINKIVQNDAETYVCKATNVVGSTEDAANLTVHCKIMIRLIV